MDRAGFAAYLMERGVNDDLERLVDIAGRFARSTAGGSAADQLDAFSRLLIDEGDNTPAVYRALALYGRFTGDDALTAVILSFLDGAEALGNLYDRLGGELGPEERDRVFAGIELPPLGTSAAELPAVTEQVMDRLAAEVDPALTEAVLSGCLRDLDDAWFADARAHWLEHRDVDALLEWRRERLLETLEERRRSGRPWFVQEITAEVVEFVRAHPEVAGGVREGDVVVEVKIPHMTKQWLEAADDRERRYHYCHCPWVKESFRQEGIEIPAVFCSCSAGFHKRFWEVVLGRPLEAEIRESVLAGDDRCTIAIHLPAEVLRSGAPAELPG